MNKLQLNYAAGRPQMYDSQSRIKRAYRIVKMFEDYYDKGQIKNLTLLDIGSSTGIIDNYLADKFNEVTGIDIDEKAIKFASKKFKKKNLTFKIGDAMKLEFCNNSFDIVICTQIYEHVPDPKRLLAEIYRVLKPNGVCFFAAINKLWPWEPHYNLPFLSWLPRNAANIYVRLFRGANEYYETPRTYWGLKKLCGKFKIKEYTQKILRNPVRFGYEDKIHGAISLFSYLMSPLAKCFSSTFFWLLVKEA